MYENEVDKNERSSAERLPLFLEQVMHQAAQQIQVLFAFLKHIFTYTYSTLVWHNFNFNNYFTWKTWSWIRQLMCKLIRKLHKQIHPKHDVSQRWVIVYLSICDIDCINEVEWIRRTNHTSVLPQDFTFDRQNVLENLILESVLFISLDLFVCEYVKWNI